MEHTKHIIRAVLLLVTICIVFILVRHFAIPKSFGAYGHYRYDSVAEYKEQEPQHGAPGSCRDCHEEEADIHADGPHASVSCEVCHGQLAVHVQNDERIGPMPINNTWTWCAKCHERLVARPKTFPQVVFRDHLREQNVESHKTICLECHNAHNPAE